MEFMKKLTVVMFATALVFSVACSQNQEDKPKKMDKIGVQLYTLRNEMAQDVDATLKKVSELGYKEVEFAGYFDHTPQEIRAMLDKYNLQAPAVHAGLDQVVNNFDETTAAAKVIGHKYVIIPWVNANEYNTVAKYKELAQQLNNAAIKAQAEGLRIAYHNHDFEFKPVEGVIPFDLLMQETDEELVDFEMDLFWAVRAGQDPLTYFEKYPGRIKLCHVKDMTADSSMTDVGSGVINFSEIFKAGEAAGLKHFIVEHDRPKEAFTSIENSIDYLKELTY